MSRPRIDPGQKIKDVLQHVECLSKEAECPWSHYKRSAGNIWNLGNYVERKIGETRHYGNVAQGHKNVLNRMILVNLVETFERFLKEIAAVCIDHLLQYVLDDRFDAFPIKGSVLAAHFAAKTAGKSLCESDTWLDCESINKRFRRLLADPFDAKKGAFYLFPRRRRQDPEAEHSRYEILSLLWQLRHTLVHNVGVVTESDAVKFRLLVRRAIDAPRLLSPTRDDLRYVKRFLDETAQESNRRIGKRLAELLSTLHRDDRTLFEPQEKANRLTRQFDMSLTVAAAIGAL